MKEIKLTRGQVALIDDDDFEMVNQFKWYAQKRKNTYYAMRRTKTIEGRTSVSMHRFIMQVNNIKTLIDHKDLNGLNNQKSNLRFCTLQENNRNRRPNKNCSSIYKGVSWDKTHKLWRSYIKQNDNQIKLGYYKNELDAARAYNKRAKELFGEFSRLNIF